MKKYEKQPQPSFFDYQESLKELGFVLQNFMLTSLKLLLLKRPVSWFYLDWFQQDFLFSKHVLYWFVDDQNFQEEGNFVSRKLMYGQTYNKVRAFVFGFDCLKRIGVLVFGKGLSGNI